MPSAAADECHALLLVLGLAACGPEVPARVPGAPDTVVVGSAPAPTVEKPPSKAGDGAFHAAWLQQTPPFNEGVAIAPNGRVAVVATRSLSLHHPRTGAMLAKKEVCAGAHFTFVDDNLGALVCEDAVRLLALPELEYRSMHAFADKARLAAFATGLAAVSFANAVRVFDTASWTERHAFTPGDRVTALAIDSTQLAVGLERGDVLLYPLRAPNPRRIQVKPGLEVEALAFSPDGTRLFAGAGPLAAWWRTADGTLERRFETVGAVTAARWLDDRRIAVVSRDGLLLLSSAGSIGSVDGSGALGGAPPVGLAVRGDRLCVAERDGKLACFARGRLPPSRPLAIDLDPARAYGSVMAGRVVRRQGARLEVMALPRSELPQANTAVVLLRYTEQKAGPARWIRIAEGRVLKVVDETVSLRIDGELTPLEGVKEPLALDIPLRLAWQPHSE